MNTSVRKGQNLVHRVACCIVDVVSCRHLQESKKEKKKKKRDNAAAPVGTAPTPTLPTHCAPLTFLPSHTIPAPTALVVDQVYLSTRPRRNTKMESQVFFCLRRLSNVDRVKELHEK